MKKYPNLSKYKIIGIDTNIFIYYFQKHAVFGPNAKWLFTQLASNQLQAVTSIITLTELLSFKASRSMLDKLEAELYSIPNLSILEVNRIIAKVAAKIGREYGYRLPDAIQLATAQDSKVQAFITNDDRLKRFKKLPIILLKDVKP